MLTSADRAPSWVLCEGVEESAGAQNIHGDTLQLDPTPISLTLVDKPRATPETRGIGRGKVGVALLEFERGIHKGGLGSRAPEVHCLASFEGVAARNEEAVQQKSGRLAWLITVVASARRIERTLKHQLLLAG